MLGRSLWTWRHMHRPCWRFPLWMSARMDRWCLPSWWVLAIARRANLYSRQIMKFLPFSSLIRRRKWMRIESIVEFGAMHQCGVVREYAGCICVYMPGRLEWYDVCQRCGRLRWTVQKRCDMHWSRQRLPLCVRKRIYRFVRCWDVESAERMKRKNSSANGHR